MPSAAAGKLPYQLGALPPGLLELPLAQLVTPITSDTHDNKSTPTNNFYAHRASMRTDFGLGILMALPHTTKGSTRH